MPENRERLKRIIATEYTVGDTLLYCPDCPHQSPDRPEVNYCSRCGAKMQILDITDAIMEYVVGKEDVISGADRITIEKNISTGERLYEFSLRRWKPLAFRTGNKPARRVMAEIRWVPVKEGVEGPRAAWFTRQALSNLCTELSKAGFTPDGHSHE